MKTLPAILLLILLVNPRDGMAQRPVLHGPYFGQVRPGQNAEIFAPGMVSIQGRYEYDLQFSSTGTEFNFLTRSVHGSIDTLYCTRTLTNWTGPMKLNIPGRPWVTHRIKLPFGENGYLDSQNRFVLFDKTGENGNNDIYMAIREKKGEWSAPLNLGSEVNTYHSETHPTLSQDGKFLFFSRYNEVNEMADIYWIRTDLIYEISKKYRKK